MFHRIAVLCALSLTVVGAITAGNLSVLNYSPADVSNSSSLPPQVFNSNFPQFITWTAAGVGNPTITITLRAMGLDSAAWYQTPSNSGIYPPPGPLQSILWLPPVEAGATVAVHASDGSDPAVTEVSNVFNAEDLATSMIPTCTSTTCLPITVKNDPPFANSTFSGYADPAIRRDPATGYLWMGYSFPEWNTDASGSSQAVALHLASSVDGGVTWVLHSPNLWESVLGGSSCLATQYSSHEVLDMWPANYSWYSVHEDYCVTKDSGYTHLYDNFASGRMVLTLATGSATSPATPNQINSPTSSAAWPFSSPTGPAGMTQRLNQVLRTGYNCSKGWNEPAIFVDPVSARAYVAAQCLDVSQQGYTSPGPQYFIFALNTPTDLVLADVNTIYGPFGGGTNAFQTEMTVSVRPNLTLLATLTSASGSPGSETHLGCKVYEFHPTQSPTQILGALDASIPDITNGTLAGGDGACSYESASGTGLLMVKRNTNLIFSILETGLMP